MPLPQFKLISFDLCPYVQRARVVLNEKNIPYELEFIDLDAPPEWFYEISPLEKVPVLLADGKAVFESTVICEYLDEVTPESLHPADPFKKAQNRAWMEFGNEMLANTYTYFTTDDSLQFKQTRAKLLDRFDILEEELTHTPFFNGENFSIVDAVYGPLFRVYNMLTTLNDFNFFADTAKILNWKASLLAYPAVINSVPDSYTEDMIAYLKRQDSVLNNSAGQT
ncbi:MAG: glutathione S-transferase family protein [Thiohalomonadales bacterium]